MIESYKLLTAFNLEIIQDWEILLFCSHVCTRLRNTRYNILLRRTTITRYKKNFDLDVKQLRYGRFYIEKYTKLCILDMWIPRESSMQRIHPQQGKCISDVVKVILFYCTYLFVQQLQLKILYHNNITVRDPWWLFFKVERGK